VALAGFGQRTSPSVGVLDRIFTKALYLENGPERLLVITADLLCIPHRLGTAVVAALATRTGLEPRQICVCASHSHSAPAVEGDYAQFVEAAMVRAGHDALLAARPAALIGGVGRTDLLRNRRTRGDPNVVDDRVPVLAAIAGDEPCGDGTPFALLFGVGCHPVTLGWDNPSISGDFPTWAQRALERDLPGATALFFNTTEGNVVPVTSPNRDSLDPRGYCGGSLADTARVGDAIAAEVLRVVGDAKPLPWRLAAARATLELPPPHATDSQRVPAALDAARAVLAAALGGDFETHTPPARIWAAASDRVVRRDLPEADMRELMIACCHYLGARARRSDAAVTVPIQVFAIGDFVFAALPGEVLVELGLAWSARVGSPRAFALGLANAHLRYLPHPSHFLEPKAAVRYETVTAGLDADGVSALLDAATRLWRERVAPQA
jgi:hypothetical protein